MAQMIRKQIYIDADNERFLKRRASELGVTEAEVVRQALDEAEDRAASAIREEALRDLLAYIREHRMPKEPLPDGTDTGWVFNREELYDEVYEERIERPRRRHEESMSRSSDLPGR